MTDEIVGGVDRPPRLRSRVGLVVVAVALLGYAVTHRYPAPPTDSTPAPPPRLAIPDRAARPELVGRIGAGPAGLRLLVDGYQPRVIDAHTLAVTPVPGLDLRPGLTAQVLQIGRSMLAALSPLYGPNGGVYLLRPGAAPRLVGDEGYAIPSRDGGILMATHRHGATLVTGLTLDRRVQALWQLPGNVLLLRDTPAGLVLARYADAVAGDADLLLVDRRTGRLTRRLGHGRYAVATADRSIAWAPVRCDPGCAVVVTELSTGASRRYPVYRRPVLAAGAFSPDGRQLALSFSGIKADGAGPLEAGRVAILDLRTGRQAYVPQLSTPPAEHADVTWSADGQWLVLGVKYPRRERIAVWRPGHDVVILPVELPGEPTTATLATLP